MMVMPKTSESARRTWADGFFFLPDNDFYEKPPTAAQMDRLKNLSPADAATLRRLLNQAKTRS